MPDGCDRETPMEALKRVSAELDSMKRMLLEARDINRLRGKQLLAAEAERDSLAERLKKGQEARNRLILEAVELWSALAPFAAWAKVLKGIESSTPILCFESRDEKPLTVAHLRYALTVYKKQRSARERRIAVALEPVNEPCSVCSGTGLDPEDESCACPKCNETGVQPRAALSAPPSAPAAGEKCDSKLPAGYRVRMGTGLGHGRYVAHFQAPDGFRWQADVHSREEAVQIAIRAAATRSKPSAPAKCSYCEDVGGYFVNHSPDDQEWVSCPKCKPSAPESKGEGNAREA